MLTYLRIRGLALLDDVTLELGGGLNVLTGETGAGKSIIVDALALLRGARGRAELVRSGVDVAIVDAQLEPSAAVAPRVAAVLARHGLPSLDGALVLQRTVARGGRGRCSVQGELVPHAVLAEVCGELVDICSQHEHHSLTEVARHGEVLDAYAGIEPEVAEYAARYRELALAQGELRELRARADAARARADFLRFQIDEIERIAPLPGEHESLVERLTLLRDARAWSELARQVEATLYEADDAVAPRLQALAERARRGAGASERLARIAEQLDAARFACEEAVSLAERLGAELELEPGELERAEERKHELDGLARKHGPLAGIEERLQALREELALVEEGDARSIELEALVAALLADGHERARRLAQARRRSARALASALEAELAALHLPRARLEARIEALPAGELGPRGTDRVELAFSANAGEPLAPLARVASGGELSRVLLALKGALASGDRVATYVFDEIDAGVGGAVAESIGRRLSRAAAAHQVLCITHLPQIAAFASAHFHVGKGEVEGRTVTRVTRLADAARVEELARMLGGRRVGESAREHARALLAEAGAAAEESEGARGPAAPPGSRGGERRAPASAARRRGAR
ncbi:MAG: DNA repair protein RecN [Polyangiaceae bacterium]|nr:DNA repair protein RecN [Polyangiaceae bacterium]